MSVLVLFDFLVAILQHPVSGDAFLMAVREDAFVMQFVCYLVTAVQTSVLCAFTCLQTIARVKVGMRMQKCLELYLCLVHSVIGPQDLQLQLQVWYGYLAGVSGGYITECWFVMDWLSGRLTCC